jgi:hypothetical protein
MGLKFESFYKKKLLGFIIKTIRLQTFFRQFRLAVPSFGNEMERLNIKSPCNVRISENQQNGKMVNSLNLP